MNEVLLKNLYIKYNLSQKGDFNTFKSDMAFPSVRKAFYNKYGLSKKGSYATFEADLLGKNNNNLQTLYNKLKAGNIEVPDYYTFQKRYGSQEGMELLHIKLQKANIEVPDIEVFKLKYLYTEERMLTALRNAHNAGDKKAATIIAKTIVELRNSENTFISSSNAVEKGSNAKWCIDNEKTLFDELSSFFDNEEETQLVEETTTEVVESVSDYDPTEEGEPVVSDYETTQTNRDYNQEFILIDPMTKLRWKIFKNEFWWIYYPLLFLAFFLVYKLSRFSFRWIKQNLSIAKLKEFFITINANELKVLNVHKRMCQFLTVLCIYVLIKRNHFQQPLFLIVYAIIISSTWFLYYFIKTFSAKILHILIRYEKIVLYSIIMNFIHQNYSYFYGDGSYNGLLYLGYFPAIVYIIIYIFNLKTSINFPFLSQLKKINPVTNFYIQQNIYLTFLLSISYLTGKFELNYILYVVVFIWVGSLLYSKLFDKSE